MIKSFSQCSLALGGVCLIVFGVISCGVTDDASGPVTSGSSPRMPQTALDVEVVVVNTRLGRIIIELNDARAPKHSQNFRTLAVEGKLNGTTFHRVIPDFIIQGGDPNSRDADRSNDGFGGPGYTVPFEGGLQARRGSVVMARLPDSENPERASNGSQFYILLRDAPNLTGVDTVFGRVVIGMDVVERIASQPADENDNPIDPITMTASVMPFEKARQLGSASRL